MCLFKCCCHKELWDGIISFPFLKDGPVCPMLKEIRKEALKHLSLAFREFEQHLSWLPLRYFQVISLRNVTKQKTLTKEKDHGSPYGVFWDLQNVSLWDPCKNTEMVGLPELKPSDLDMWFRHLAYESLTAYCTVITDTSIKCVLMSVLNTFHTNNLIMSIKRKETGFAYWPLKQKLATFKKITFSYIC